MAPVRRAGFIISLGVGLALVVMYLIGTTPGAAAGQAKTAVHASEQSAASCWAVVTSPHPVDSNWGLHGLDGVSADDIWAVGFSTGSNGFHALIQHWNGTSWANVPAPTPPIDSSHSLTAVAAATANDAWAIGGYIGGGPPLVLRWNGKVWSNYTITLPPSLSSVNLIGITAVAANDVWAVGSVEDDSSSTPFQTLVLHWNGSNWSRVPSPSIDLAGNALQSIAAAGPADIWAAGIYSQGGGTYTLTEHWNGTRWSIVASPSPGVRLNGLAGVTVLAANNAWAVGSTNNTSDPQFTESLVLHWDGQSWTRVAAPNPGVRGVNELLGIAALAAGDIWAVGRYANNAQVPQTLIEHWNGSSWTVAPNASPGTNDNTLEAVIAVPGGDVWAAGRYGAIDGNHGLLERYSAAACGAATATATRATATATRTATPPATATRPAATRTPVAATATATRVAATATRTRATNTATRVAATATRTSQPTKTKQPKRTPTRSTRP